MKKIKSVLRLLAKNSGLEVEMIEMSPLVCFLNKFFREFEVPRKWPPEHLSECFLYQTDSIFHNKEFGNLQIVREGRNLPDLGKKQI